VGVGAGVGTGAGAGLGGTTAACSIRIACPATMAVPVRAAPVFASMVSVVAPVPLFDAGSTCIHDDSDAAVHAQADDAVSTLTVRRALSGPGLAEVGDTLNWHWAASCATTIWELLTVSVARRAEGSTFEPTR
jgi:hypothetical protein